jgi:hypothetical protein
MLGVIFSVKPRTQVRVKFRVKVRSTDRVMVGLLLPFDLWPGLVLGVWLVLQLGLGLGSWLA